MDASCNISNMEDSASSGYPNTEKFEVFGKPMKHGLECLIYLLNR